MYVKNKNFIFFMFIFLWLSLSIMTLAKENIFGISSGLIEYTINGKGILTKESNITIEGKASFYFDNWGILNIEKEEGIFLVSGAIKHKQEIKRLEKQTKEKIIVVDYKNKKLFERKNPMLFDYKKALTEGLEEEGEVLILGYVCKVWVGKGIKKYIHKGILLRKEVEIFGISYVKMVSEIVLDVNLSEEVFKLPTYPTQNIGLFRVNMKSQNAMRVEDFCTRIKDIRLLETSVLEREKFINDIGEDTFNTQKETLPKLLLLLKETRFCLQAAKNPFIANSCIEELSRFTEKFGTHIDDYIIVWNAKRKEDLLEKIEEDIRFLESRMVCVNRAKHLIDLSTCMK